jgi:hypothetical protein
VNHFLGSVVIFGALAAIIVFAIHANLALRDGSWWPNTTLRDGRFLMRRWVNGEWEYRTPTEAELVEHYNGGKI